jgi:hypothetical protein
VREGFTGFYKKIENLETDTVFTYRIADYFTPINTQNTIYCVMVKGQTKAEATISFGFSTFGSNGTDYTLKISPVSDRTGIVGEEGVFNFKVVLYNYSGEEIKLDRTSASVITPNGLEQVDYSLVDGVAYGEVDALSIPNPYRVLCFSAYHTVDDNDLEK